VLWNYSDGHARRLICPELEASPSSIEFYYKHLFPVDLPFISP
jgi:hypothetical protein